MRKRSWRRWRLVLGAAITAAMLIAVIRAARPGSGPPTPTLPRAPEALAAPSASSTTDVPAQLFTLLRTEDITSEVFSCPTTQPSHWEFGGGKNTALNWCTTQQIQPHDLRYIANRLVPSTRAEERK